MPKKDRPKKTLKTAPPDTVMGRPTSYREEFAREAMLLCRLGATDPEMADFFGITVRTLNRWKVTHPDFVEAIKRGKEPSDDRVVDSLYHRAMGTEYEEARPIKLKTVTYDENGRKRKEEERVEVVMVNKVIPADTAAMIFWLKNRRNKEWRDIQQVETGAPGDFARLSDEELDDTIKALQDSVSATQH
jgi:hypothetical protein